MRGGQGCHLTRVDVARGVRTVRRRDTGSWRDVDLQRTHAGLVVYLNRFEGIPLEEFEAARLEHPNFDLLPDAKFRRLIPSARDSMIVIDPGLARIAGHADRE